MAIAAVGCGDAVVTSVGPDAPIWLSEDLSIHDPFVFRDGKKVQVKGKVQRRMGDLVVTPPTPPAKGTK